MTESTPIPTPDAVELPARWPVQYTQICGTTLCPVCKTPTQTGARVYGIKIMVGERPFRIGEGYCRLECAEKAVELSVFATAKPPGVPVVIKPRTDDVAFGDWIEQACPERPPSPPGWDEWWASHREKVQKTITQARVQMGQQIEYGVLKMLEREGQIDNTVAQKILKKIEAVYMRETALRP